MPRILADAQFLEFRANLEEWLHQFDEAIYTLGRLLEHANSPNKPALLARRGLIYQALGNFDNVLADLDHVLELLPDDGSLHRLRVNLFQDQPGDGTILQLERAQLGSTYKANVIARHDAARQFVADKSLQMLWYAGPALAALPNAFMWLTTRMS